MGTLFWTGSSAIEPGMFIRRRDIGVKSWVVSAFMDIVGQKMLSSLTNHDKKSGISIPLSNFEVTLQTDDLNITKMKYTNV